MQTAIQKISTAAVAFYFLLDWVMLGKTVLTQEWLIKGEKGARRSVA